MESLGRMTAMILAIILMFLFPLRYDACKACLSEDSYMGICLDRFYYEVVQKKELTKQQYDDFLYQLSAGGNSFEVEIDYYHKVMNDKVEYLIYEDGSYLCCKDGILQVKNGDYLSIRLIRNNIPFAQRLMNWCFPTFYRKNTYTTGGYII